jgi:hypothetical protein
MRKSSFINNCLPKINSNFTTFVFRKILNNETPITNWIIKKMLLVGVLSPIKNIKNKQINVRHK